ncbi:MAG: HlyD family secretion protein, partial [Thiomicrorhabdus sp.]|nr:HlyD family secretion protein [Thiomicrorhabdus sp.]
EGEKLAQLSSPELTFRIKVTELNIAKIQSKLDRIATFSEDRYQVDVLQEALQQEQEALVGLKKRQKLLQITSPIDGVVTDLKTMTKGQSVGVNQHLIGVVAPTDIELVAFLPENQINAVSTGAKGTFIANHGEELQADLMVTSIEKMGIQQLEYEILSSVYGGSLGVRENQEGKMVPETPYFLIKLKTKNLPEKPWMQQTAGKVIVEADPKSGLSILWDKVMAVLIRESGF